MGKPGIVSDTPIQPGPGDLEAQAAADFVRRGRTLMARGEYHEAIRECRLGLLVQPGLVEGRAVLGMALLALGRHDDVLPEMRALLEMGGDNATAPLLGGEAPYRPRPLFAVALQSVCKESMVMTPME